MRLNQISSGGTKTKIREENSGHKKKKNANQKSEERGMVRGGFGIQH